MTFYSQWVQFIISYIIKGWYISYSARVDGLVRKEQSSNEMKETFKGREDFLCLRHVFYNKRVKKFEPAEIGNKKTIMVTKLCNYINIMVILYCITENCWRVWTWSFQASHKRCCSAKLSAKRKSNWTSLSSLPWAHHTKHPRICDTTAVCWPGLQFDLVSRYDFCLPCWSAWSRPKR